MPKISPFEKYSDAYDEWFEKNRDLYEAELEAIRQVLYPVGAEGLEIGVGSGKFAAPLGIKIGVEPSKNMAIKARKLGINVYRGIAEDLPFPDGAFDFVLMVTTICFVDDVAKSFSEAFRVLKPGGCIVIGFLDKESELGKMYAEKREKSKFYQEATFFSTQEILNYLENTGFCPSKIKQTIVSGRSPKIIFDNFGKGSFVVIRGEK
ncbi:MAG: SAM-dependent methyltransferase [Deltaproteobacteria bacterium]|nr:MAG: SAM-dependent methyltransferase [Deltaproteobacteria bacterium]